MKTKILNLAAIMLFLIGSSSSCEKENFTTLPPETQTGANTFGCYVNGELFVAQRGYAPFGRYWLSATYSKTDKTLIIGGYGKAGTIGMSILNPVEKTISKISRAGCRINNIHYEEDNIFIDETIDIGESYITRFDTIGMVASGTFSCKLRLDTTYMKYDYLQDTIMNITQGRFDIKILDY
jgi:hypothetical protein